MVAQVKLANRAARRGLRFPDALQRVQRFDETGSDGFHRSWIMLFPVGHYEHEQYGELDFTPAKLRKIKTQYEARVRHIDAALDVDHRAARDDSRATGWIESLELREAQPDGTPAGLWGCIKWTPYGLKFLRSDEYRYFSPEFGPWDDPQTGEHFDDVLIGGALTNRPFLKTMPAIALADWPSERGAMLLFNPNHDSHTGEFSSGGGGASGGAGKASGGRGGSGTKGSRSGAKAGSGGAKAAKPAAAEKASGGAGSARSGGSKAASSGEAKHGTAAERQRAHEAEATRHEEAARVALHNRERAYAEGKNEESDRFHAEAEQHLQAAKAERIAAQHEATAARSQDAHGRQVPETKPGAESMQPLVNPHGASEQEYLKAEFPRMYRDDNGVERGSLQLNSAAVNARFIAHVYGEHQTGAVLSRFSPRALRASAKEAGLETKGSKAELVSRLTSHATEGRYKADFGKSAGSRSGSSGGKRTPAEAHAAKAARLQAHVSKLEAQLNKARSDFAAHMANAPKLSEARAGIDPIARALRRTIGGLELMLAEARDHLELERAHALADAGGKGNKGGKDMPAATGAVSRKPWGQVDKACLPASCFLIVGDPAKKTTWKLPVYEGAGPRDADGNYTKRGALNLNGVKAAWAAVNGAHTGQPMAGVPASVKTQLQRWRARYFPGRDANAASATKASESTESTESMSQSGEWWHLRMQDMDSRTLSAVSQQAQVRMEGRVGRKQGTAVLDSDERDELDGAMFEDEDGAEDEAETLALADGGKPAKGSAAMKAKMAALRAKSSLNLGKGKGKGKDAKGDAEDESEDDDESEAMAEDDVEDEDRAEMAEPEDDESEAYADDDESEEYDEADGDGEDEMLADGEESEEDDADDDVDPEEDDGAENDDEEAEDEMPAPRRRGRGGSKSKQMMGARTAVKSGPSLRASEWASEGRMTREHDDTMSLAEAQRLRKELAESRKREAEMAFRLYEGGIEKTLTDWGRGKFQFKESAKSAPKTGRIALSKSFREAFRAFMRSEGVRLSETTRGKLLGLVEIALSSAVVDLSERGSSYDPEGRMVSAASRRLAGDDDKLQAEAERIALAEFGKPLTALTGDPAKTLAVYERASKNINY